MNGSRLTLPLGQMLFAVRVVSADRRIDFRMSRQMARTTFDQLIEALSIARDDLANNIVTLDFDDTGCSISRASDRPLPTEAL